MRRLKLLLEVGPTLAISIDTTDSMAGIIDRVKVQAIEIVDSRVGMDQEPIQYVLAPFDDPDTGPVTVTSEPETFKAALSALFAHDGGDCPELCMTGALQALSSVDEGADLFTLTDASAKDASLAGSVSSPAEQKDAKLRVGTRSSPARDNIRTFIRGLVARACAS